MALPALHGFFAVAAIEKNTADGELHVHVSWVDLQNSVVFDQCFFPPHLGVIRIAQVEMRAGMVGIKRDGFGAFLHRVVEAAHLKEKNTKVELSGKKSRIDRKGLAIKFFRARIIVGAKKTDGRFIHFRSRRHANPPKTPHDPQQLASLSQGLDSTSPPSFHSFQPRVPSMEPPQNRKPESLTQSAHPKKRLRR
jgi:hypothetical protein